MTSFAIDPDLLGLVDNVALVVGGAGAGMGRSHCVQLARAGCHIVVADRDADAGAETVAAVEAVGREALFVKTDALVADDVDRAVKAALERFDRLDVAVNHVGGSIGRGPFLDYDEDDWDKTVALSLKTTFYGCRAEALAMIERGIQGRIINVGSTQGVAAADADSAYGAAKAAVIHLTKSLGYEFAKWGIRVNCIVPGKHVTSFAQSQAPERFSMPTVNWPLEANAKAPPMRRLGEGMETAGLAVFFASRLSSYVTGHSLASDGGLLLTLNRPQRDGIPDAVARLGKRPVIE